MKMDSKAIREKIESLKEDATLEEITEIVAHIHGLIYYQYYLVSFQEMQKNSESAESIDEVKENLMSYLNSVENWHE